MRAILLEFHDIAPEVRHFLFEASEVEQLHFKAGQFVSLKEMVNGKQITRPYSIVSLPGGNRFELLLEPGSRRRLHAAFVLDETGRFH